MAPIAIGTETDGSILVPSDRAGLYSLKYTVGKVSTAGTLPYTRITDSIGPMTKCAKDVATICDVITPIAGQSHHDFLSGSFSGMKIGFLDPVEWASGPVAVRPNSDYTEQTVCLFHIPLGAHATIVLNHLLHIPRGVTPTCRGCVPTRWLTDRPQERRHCLGDRSDREAGCQGAAPHHAASIQRRGRQNVQCSSM